jgi:hypothetical protein
MRARKSEGRGTRRRQQDVHVRDDGEVSDQKSFHGARRTCEKGENERKKRREERKGRRRTGTEGKKSNLGASFAVRHNVGGREGKIGGIDDQAIERGKRGNAFGGRSVKSCLSSTRRQCQRRNRVTGGGRIVWRGERSAPLSIKTSTSFETPACSQAFFVESRATEDTTRSLMGA